MGRRTLTEDQLDAGRSKRHVQQRKQHEALIRSVRVELERGLNQSQIARELEVSRYTVSKIVRHLNKEIDDEDLQP